MATVSDAVNDPEGGVAVRMTLKVATAVTLAADAEINRALINTTCGPFAWMAPESFTVASSDGDATLLRTDVSPAGDVYMLGSCFVEVMTKCTRLPFDCLTGAAAVVQFRRHSDSRGFNCMEVRTALV